MNRYPEHNPLRNPIESTTAALCSGKLVGPDDLRQLLSELGLHADSTQETTLLELIHESHNRKQCLTAC